MWVLFWAFFIWLGFWLFKGLFRGYRLYRQSRRAFNDLFGNSGRGPKQQAGKKQSPPKPRKKIDPSVGEYVHYEEVEVTAETVKDSETKKTTTKITVEEQIVDVEWEDIP